MQVVNLLFLPFSYCANAIKKNPIISFCIAISMELLFQRVAVKPKFEFCIKFKFFDTNNNIVYFIKLLDIYTLYRTQKKYRLIKMSIKRY